MGIDCQESIDVDIQLEVPKARDSRLSESWNGRDCDLAVMCTELATKLFGLLAC